MAAAAILSFGKKPYFLNGVRYQIEILHVYYSGPFLTFPSVEIQYFSKSTMAAATIL